MIGQDSSLTRRLKTDPLLRNSVYLMLSTAIMAAFGLVFWVLVAHYYSPSQVGIAATLISSMNFIAYLCLLGFNSAFVHFLPTSRARNSQISTGIFLVSLATIVVSSTYVLLAPVYAPKLSFLHHPWLGLGFVALCLGAAVNLLTDSIFIAYRSAGYNTLIDGFLASGTQLALPVLLVGLGAFGVFAAQGWAAFVAMVVSITALVIKFGFRPQLRIDRAILRQVVSFASGNYLANLLNISPAIILPIIILSRLGAAAAGYYYLAFMMANLLFTVAYAVSQSLFAEGSYAQEQLRHLVRRSVVILGIIMIPGGLLLATAGPFVLGIFGKTYHTSSGPLLVVLAAAAPFVAAYVLGSVLLRIAHQIKQLIIANLFYAVVICGLASWWAHRGLEWVALAWLIGHALTALLIFGVMRPRSTRQIFPSPAAE